MPRTQRTAGSQGAPDEATALTFIDLFSGCGGFSLGLEWSGLKCLAAADFNESAIETFRANHPDVPHALVRDLTKFRPEELGKLLGPQAVDLVVGGPFRRARQGAAYSPIPSGPRTSTRRGLR